MRFCTHFVGLLRPACPTRESRFVSMLLAVALGLAVGAGSGAQAQSFRFSDFDVRGNTRITDSAILTYAGVSPGAVVSGAQVNAALRRLQDTGLFEEVTITPRGGTLVIEVAEYPTINRISVEGNDRLDDDELLSQLESTPRRAYSPSVAEQDAATIAEAYRVSGRLTATDRKSVV